MTTRSWRGSTSAPPTRISIDVKNEILTAFGPSLARVEMTHDEGKPIAAAGRRAEAAKAAAAQTIRFAGGREYELTFNTTAFNSTEPRAQVISAAFAKVLDKATITNPTSRFEIVHRARSARATDATGAAAGSQLILRTDLEPDNAKTLLATLEDNLVQQPRPALRADHPISTERSPAKRECSP